MYMDDLRLHYETDRRENEIILKSDAEKGIWEIADFEDGKQNFFLGCERSGVREPLKSTNKVVNAGYYNIKAPSGNNVLELTMRAGVNNSKNTKRALVVRRYCLACYLRGNPKNGLVKCCLKLFYLHWKLSER